MAVAFDAVGGGVANGSHSTTAQTWSHTVATGAGVVVILGFASNEGAISSTTWANAAPTAVTFGGQNMTFLADMTDNNVTTAKGAVALYTLLNPTNRGAQTVSVTGTAAVISNWANTVSYTGVGSVGSGVTNFGSSTNPTTGAVTSATGHMVVSILGTNQVAASSPTQTSRYSQSGTSSINSGYIQDAAGAATVTTAMTAAAALWAAVAVDLAPATATNLFFPMFR